MFIFQEDLVNGKWSRSHRWAPGGGAASWWVWLTGPVKQSKYSNVRLDTLIITVMIMYELLQSFEEVQIVNNSTCASVETQHSNGERHFHDILINWKAVRHSSALWYILAPSFWAAQFVKWQSDQYIWFFLSIDFLLKRNHLMEGFAAPQAHCFFSVCFFVQTGNKHIFQLSISQSLDEKFDLFKQFFMLEWLI